MAKQGIAVLLGPVGQMVDEVFDLLTSRVTQLFSPAEIGRVGLNETGIELMLADELAQPVADPGPAIPIAVAMETGCDGSFMDSREDGTGSTADPISSAEQMPTP